MGLTFDKLPVNTLVGADWKTFKALTTDQHIGNAYKGKYRLTKMAQPLCTMCLHATSISATQQHTRLFFRTLCFGDNRSSKRTWLH